MAVVEGELSQGRGGRAAGSLTFQAAAAVTCLAGEVSVRLGALGAGPDTAGPEGGGGGERAVGDGVEGETSALKNRVAGVGLDGGPNSEGTVVDDC